MKNYDMKSNNKDKKFKGKKDTRDNNASETNGMHSVPLRRKHQMQLGKPKGKIREKNLKGYSKFQNKLLNYLNNSQNSPEQSIQNVIGQDHFSSWKNGMCSFVVGNSTDQFSSITENQNKEFILKEDPGPAAESKMSPQSVTYSDKMLMFIAPVAMLSAQSHSLNWMVDLGAGMSGTSSTNNLRDTMSCLIPLTPAFGSVLNATAEGVISDPTLTKLGIRAVRINGMHHNLLSVHQVLLEAYQDRNMRVYLP